MFIGHLALGFAAKRVTPQLSLVVLLLASQLADTLWPVLVASGVEQVRIDPGNTALTPLDFVSYPYSHSLLLLIVWGVIFGWLCRFLVGNGKVFAVILALVVSHWVLDVITHRPDMPLYPGGPKLGLGLWNSIPATLTVELTMFAAGLWVYVRATRAKDRTGRWAFVSLATFLVVAYLANTTGTPPPSVRVLYISAMVGAAFLMLWSWWADRHRESVMWTSRRR